eukprot:766435-Hanusia_phi.AAC.4
MATGKATRLSAVMAAIGRRGMADAHMGDKLPFHKRVRGVVRRHARASSLSLLAAVLTPPCAGSICCHVGRGTCRNRFRNDEVELDCVEQHTSPFEIQHVNGLFANFGAKLKHKVFDLLPDMIPAALVLGVVMG